MKIPFFLVTGFLGSGKTTLLRRFINEHADTRRIAVVQNEFADIGIDATQLSRTGKPFALLEMNKGSVFCVCLLADFTKGCAALIAEHRPDAVILEATGLADPIAVAQILQCSELKDLVYLSHVWAVLDASSFLKMEPVVRRIAQQVRIADTVIINKIDLIDNAQTMAVLTLIAQINPYAQTVKAHECDVLLNNVFAYPDGAAVAVTHGDAFADLPTAARPPVVSAALRSTRRIRHRDLIAFLDRFKGECYRIKGYVQLENNETVMVQCVMDQVNVTGLKEYTGPTELIGLGAFLDADEFRYVFENIGR